jgi:hypothetical protein
MSRSFLKSALLLGALCAACLLPATAQPKAEIKRPAKIDPEVASRRGQALVNELLSQQPESDSETTGLLTVRNRQGQSSSVKVHFLVTVTPTNFISRYAAAPREGAPAETVYIHQRVGQPNTYFVAEDTNSPLRQLTRQEVMRPFAGSDFWVADLGLDFLHWPGQMVVRQEMKRGQSCEVLESFLPTDAAGGYSRVVSWIASQKPGVVVVQADAYDGQGKLLKQFSPRNLQRVQGKWQLQSMEMRNRQTGSRTLIEFDLVTPAR